MQRSLCLVLLLGTAAAHAQKLPPPTREVFRCEVNGKVTYSDAPCLGARRVDVEPTRGLNASSGREQLGADVRRERFNEEFAEAFKPLTGKDARQLKVDERRMKLTPTAQRECRQLDRSIPLSEERERQSSGEARLAAQRELLSQRQQFIKLGC